MKNASIVLCHSNREYVKNFKEDFSDDFNTVKCIKKATTAFNYILRHKPDVAIIEAEIDCNIIVDIINTTSNKRIKTKFILLFTECRKEIFSIVKSIGIKGLLCITDQPKDVFICVKNVLDGKECYSKKIKDYFKSIKDERITQLEMLTPIELKILSLLGAYQETDKIASILKVNPIKIEDQMSSIKTKFKEQYRQDSLLMWAAKNNSLITSLAIYKA